MNEKLIPARFLLTLGHFIALLNVSYSKDPHIFAVYNDPTPEEIGDARSYMQAAINTGIVCFLFDMSGLLYHSLFMKKVNVLQIFLHFCGGVLLCTFTERSWPYTSLWTLVTLFNMSSALIEVMVLFATYILQIVIF